MLEVLQKLTDLNWLLHLFLVLLPGSIFVTNLSRMNFPTGRYNSGSFFKLFQFVLVSLFFFAIFPLLVKLGARILIDPFYHFIGFPKAIELFPSEGKDWAVVLTDIFSPKANIKNVIFFVVTISIVASVTSVFVSFIIFLLDLEASHNALSTYFIDFLKVHAPLIETKWAKFNEDSAKASFGKGFLPRASGYVKIIVRVFVALGLIVSGIARILYSAGVLVAWVSLVLLILGLHLISFIFFYLTQFFHHPLYTYYCRGKQGRKHAICEARLQDNVLIKGRVRTFAPKSHSEIESVFLDNVIKYTLPESQKPLHFVRGNRQSYIFPNPGSLLSIPYGEIKDINVWHYDGSLGKDHNINSHNEMDAVLWYLKLSLEMYPYRSKAIILRLQKLKVAPHVGFFFWTAAARIIIARYKRPWRAAYYLPQKELLVFVKQQLNSFVPLQVKPKQFKMLVSDMCQQSGIRSL